MSDSLWLPWTIACHIPPSMGFSRQEFWGWFPCPPSEELNPHPLCLQHKQVGSLTLAPPGKPHMCVCVCVCVADSLCCILETNKTLQINYQFSRSVVSGSLWLHGLQHARPPCPSPTPGVYSNSGPSHWWCHPTISSSVIPFSSCLQSFPTIRQ